MATPIHIIKETDLRVFAVDKEGNEQGFYKSNSNCKIIKNTRENRDKIRKLRNKVIAADKVMEKARKELYKLQNELGKEFKKL
jgi:DNA-binding IscR family transcriptional regulator